MRSAEFVTFKAWESYAKRLERANLKRDGRSLTWSSIASRANACVLDVQADRGGMLVRPGWRAVMEGQR
jgi:hypothetical protein